MFPVFAAQVLGFVVGQSLAAEVSGTEGRPDFTPADAITHPFVFEVKGTDGGDALAGHTEQVTRYLQQGRNRIKRVVLTNLWGLRVFDLDAADGLREVMHVDLRLLSIIPEAAAVAHPHARAPREVLERVPVPIADYRAEDRTGSYRPSVEPGAGGHTACMGASPTGLGGRGDPR